MVSVPNSRASSLGLSPDWGHSAVFLDKTQCLSPPRCINGLWGNPAMDSHPIWRGSSRNTPTCSRSMLLKLGQALA